MYKSVLFCLEFPALVTETGGGIGNQSSSELEIFKIRPMEI
jgi:hypothetical protein